MITINIMMVMIIITSNATGHHRGPQADVCRYVAPPGECYYTTLLCCH